MVRLQREGTAVIEIGFLLALDCPRTLPKPNLAIQMTRSTDDHCAVKLRGSTQILAATILYLSGGLGRHTNKWRHL